MKLGFVSAILDQSTFEEMIDTASDLGFQCVEVACWPQGKAERRYAGVSHIDCERIVEDDGYTAYVKEYCAKKNVEMKSCAVCCGWCGKCGLSLEKQRDISWKPLTGWRPDRQRTELRKHCSI